jgi:intracellular septation protein
MKFLFDLLPVILFFVAFKTTESRPQVAADLIGPLLGAIGLGASIPLEQSPILLATMVVMLATAAQIAWVWLRHGRVDKMLWVSLVLVVFFGGLTIALHDPTFITWKPTVLYWLFAVVLVVSASFLKKNLIRGMLEEQMSLPEVIWLRLNLAWAVFFALLGAVNLFVARNYPIETWVNFKLFGAMGLMVVFIVGQGLFLAKYAEDKQ